MEILSPGIIDAAPFIGHADDPRQPAVASCEYAFQHAHVRLMPVIFDPFLIQLLMDRLSGEPRLVQKFLLRIHGRPLEGGEGLGNEKGGAGHDLDLSGSLLLGHGFKEGGRDFVAQLGDAPDILLGFRGKAQHEIQLHPAPAALKGHGGSLQDDLLGQSLVDHVPQPLASGLRREGQAAFFHILHLSHDVQRKGVDAQGGKGNVHHFLPAGVHQEGDQLLQMGIVAGTQRAQRDLLLPRALQHVHRVFLQHVHVPLPHGPVELTRLAKTAAADTAPLDLQRHPVLGDFHEGNHRFFRIIGIRQIHLDLLDDLFRDALHGRGEGRDGAVPMVGNLI